MKIKDKRRRKRSCANAHQGYDARNKGNATAALTVTVPAQGGTRHFIQ